MRFLLPFLLFYLLAMIVAGLVRAAWRALGRRARTGPPGEGEAGAGETPGRRGFSSEEITDAEWHEVDE